MIHSARYHSRFSIRFILKTRSAASYSAILIPILWTLNGRGLTLLALPIVIDPRRRWLWFRPRAVTRAVERAVRPWREQITSEHFRRNRLFRRADSFRRRPVEGWEIV